MLEQTTRVCTLLAPPPAGTRALDGEWRVAFLDRKEAEACECVSQAFDDANWEKVGLPHLRHSTAERDTLWYRHHFRVESRSHGERLLLRFGGAFYETCVWLNGVELGEHEGFFQPFGFDVSDILQTGDNVLAVRCRFPVEAGAFKRKTAVAGIFTDWDCKPYPSTYYPNLPAPHEWTVPLGLWQRVYLQPAGDVLVESMTVFPQIVNPRWTASPDCVDLDVVLQLRNLSSSSQTTHLRIVVAPHNFQGESAAQDDWEVALEGQAVCRVERTLSLPHPRLWFPWTHGAPNLYHATLTLLSGEAAPCELTQVFGVRAIQALIGEQRWEWWLNGRRIFPKGSNYISDFYLDHVSGEGLSRDLNLAREANLDLLRVHAHIGPSEFYRQCDEQGVMVMCDFPLIWTYAFNLPSEEQEAFRASVLRQAQDMVGLLGSHPSIVLWSIHNEPPWTPDGSFLGADVHATETNRLLDEAAKVHVRTLDATRPVLAASGQYDQHLYHGWYRGHWRDNRELHPAFPSEFGVQALPNLDSPFWGTVNTNWPVDIDDPTWAHAGYQSVFWVSPGVGAPSQYPSLAEYVKESQAYQAFYIRYTIDQWRRQKFNPVGGYIHFLFTDGWPAITWSVLDYFRLPKAGYHALAQASRPAHVCVDLAGGYNESAFRLVYERGARFKADLYVVNDDYRVGGGAQLRWWLEPRRGWLRKRLKQWFAPRVTVELPLADQGARQVQSLEIALGKPGRYVFRTRLSQGRRVLDENYYELRVGAVEVRRRAPRRVPGFLVNRVYEFGSLRHTADGFSLSLHNRAVPAHIVRLVELRVDGEPVDLRQVEVLVGGESRRASTITPEKPLEVSTGERVTVVVLGRPLPLGLHELETTAELLGIGELAVRWKDRLA